MDKQKQIEEMSNDIKKIAADCEISTLSDLIELFEHLHNRINTQITFERQNRKANDKKILKVR